MKIICCNALVLPDSDKSNPSGSGDKSEQPIDSKVSDGEGLRCVIFFNF